jgi:hypothetical protein
MQIKNEMNESVSSNIIGFRQNSSCFISDIVNWWHDVSHFDDFGPWLVVNGNYDGLR